MGARIAVRADTAIAGRPLPAGPQPGAAGRCSPDEEQR